MDPVVQILLGFVVGLILWFFVRCILSGFYTVQQNERAIKTIFGRAERIEGQTTSNDPISESLTDDEKGRYEWPQVKVIPPGGPYFAFPWEKIYKVTVSTETVSIGFDPESPSANQGGQILDAVTKDQLNVGLTGQIRFTVCERNLYAYLFGIKRPVAHVMGYFISVLRERIANFSAPRNAENPTQSGTPDAANMEVVDLAKVEGISINDLRKNLRQINEFMETECASSAARYGVVLNAALITGIDPPPEVDSALAAINTANNHVMSEISIAQANADQRIVQSKRAVEIETLKAQAEVEPLRWLASQLKELRAHGPDALPTYLRNIRLRLYAKAQHIILEMKK